MTTSGELIDISRTLTAGMPVWPGDTEFRPFWVWEISAGDACNVGSVQMSLHTGTHADAPKHFREDGASPAEQPLDVYLGPARVIDLAGRSRVDRDLVKALPDDVPERLLFKTGYDGTAWTEDFPCVEPEAARLLAQRRTRLIGIDTPSVDPATSRSLSAHHALAEAGIAILENLALDRVAPGDYELIALPLKLAGMDASPIRAVLRPLDRAGSSA